MKPFFSVIIPVYNGEKYIGYAIESVKKQIYTNYEIIIIDDGSTDNTRIRVEPFLNDNIHYVFQINQGVGEARNRGIKKAKGEYVCFLDADDAFMPNKLLEYYFICLKGSVFIFSDALYIDEIQNSSYFFSKRTKIFQGKCHTKLLKNNFIVTSTVCIKKSLLKDKKFSTCSFIEDYELWLELAKKHPLTYVPSPLSYYRIHNSNISKNVQRTLYALTILYFKWSTCSFIAVKQCIRYGILYIFYRLKIFL